MENNSSVCFIGKIKKITKIENATNIELAQINGWTSIVQKGIHKEGNLILCVTTDAVIPDELAEKWGVKQYLRKGNRVRTVKLRGVYSECILIPLFDVPSKTTLVDEGMDLMEHLNIFKYEPPEIIVRDNTGRKHKYHQNPNFHVYHKFPNFKNVPNVFNEDDFVIVTRKIHGTNARYGIVKKNKLSLLDKIRKFFGNKWIEYEYVYGSHNVEKGSDSQGFYSTDVWKEIADKYDIKNKLWDFFKHSEIKTNFIIYGEIYGPGIQGEKYNYGLKERNIAFFDVEIDGEYGSNELYHHILSIDLKLPRVQIVDFCQWDYNRIFDNFVKNQFIKDTKIPHEGVVVKTLDGRRDKIAKIINPDYLIHAEKNDVPDSH